MANRVQRKEDDGKTLPAQREYSLWDPFSLMREMFRWEPSSRSESGAFVPLFEMTEEKSAYAVRADLPGVEEEDLEITLAKDRLTISGHREQERRDPDARTFTSERSFGQFTRSFALPEDADQEHLRAELQNGVLTLTIPKRREGQSKRIAIDRRGAQKRKV